MINFNMFIIYFIFSITITEQFLANLFLFSSSFLYRSLNHFSFFLLFLFFITILPKQSSSPTSSLLLLFPSTAFNLTLRFLKQIFILIIIITISKKPSFPLRFLLSCFLFHLKHLKLFIIIIIFILIIIIIIIRFFY